MNFKERFNAYNYVYELLTYNPNWQESGIDYFENLQLEEKAKITGLILQTKDINSVYDYFSNVDWHEVVDWMAAIDSKNNESLKEDAIETIILSSAKCLKREINDLFSGALSDLNNKHLYYYDDELDNYLEAA